MITSSSSTTATATYNKPTSADATTYVTASSSSNYTASTTQADSSFQINSTALTSGTGTATVTYASTTEVSVATTITTTTALTRASTYYSAQFGTYVIGSFHTIQIVSAEDGEVLRLVTTTGSSGVSDRSQIYGPTFLQTTLSTAQYSGSLGSPYATTITPRTINRLAASFGALLTFTLSDLTEITVTRQLFDGWVGGTNTQSETISGVTTFTAEQDEIVIYTVTSADAGEIAATSYSSFAIYSTQLETITGINSLGGSAEYTVQNFIYETIYRSELVYVGAPGYSFTTKRSPDGFAISQFIGQVSISRIERAGGYQSPHAIGSTGPQGASISAASSFYIGGNIGTGSPDGLLTPFLTVASTAATSNSSYSFSFGPTNCSVTALRTDTSSSTLTTFTASISATSAADTFTVNDQYAPPDIPVPSVVGGPHAWTGGQQHATINGGYGIRYTLGDSLGTTSSRETLTAPFSTRALGSSILGLECFEMLKPSPGLKLGIPFFSTFAYSAP